ncbi:FMN phosphatase YigB (HAD superfamily) [Kitasatospora sp. MAA4]|uniref:HAD-IA family hydrolase n=1 Tax=Kitasatospora sp. MAA4 TaxID=3035093 RepID=UPI0024735009|nr:HAD-IA family hydrolase [Kitasatospora sp. MAA4]MDH6132425.1 FMN phosphatase YigB (HAD superfamily) [Kitasatospora sp. MAA4]
MKPLVDGLLLDCHGLIQRFHNTGEAEGERAAGLPAGTLANYAYQHPSYDLAKVGVISNREWVQGVRDRLTADCGPQAAAAIAPWCADRGDVDWVMVDLVAQARRHVPVAVLSNFTDELHSDFAAHGLSEAFDLVLSSSDLEVQKPSPLAYQRAAERMNLVPRRIWFTDDKAEYVTAARHAGLQAALYTGVEDFARDLNALGIPVLVRF